jgi:hypothetical protein
LIENGGVTHNFESGPPKDHSNSNLGDLGIDCTYKKKHQDLTKKFK